jgi:CheY-like chemotaxis protein
MLANADETIPLPQESGAFPDGPAAVMPVKRVLLVDDNVDYVEGVALLLQISGYEVEVAHSGQEALRSALECRPDVVLLDIGMPEMDGYEVARRMREEPLLDGLRVVGVSGYMPQLDGRLSRAAHFDAYLMKPLLLPELVASLTPWPPPPGGPDFVDC